MLVFKFGSGKNSPISVSFSNNVLSFKSKEKLFDEEF